MKNVQNERNPNQQATGKIATCNAYKDETPVALRNGKVFFRNMVV